ncbi:protein P21-like [Dioscorea cayenensis subsp. rotundata]|uniref:Protein P21-like n=1 Tax=Dioscorea cayennensis subsp. rotundata TaxID=55577 RepID=A0AB40CLU5_DIOCR|nr:protein P21-like [Dioscorea cayenensis subsp. rotundata]
MEFSESVTSKYPLVFPLILPLSYAAHFDIVNQYSYTVWATTVPGGGRQLNNDETWTIKVNANTTDGYVWARTGYNCDSSSHGSCETSGCNGLLQCQCYDQPPNTLAEFTLNQFQNLDFIDNSLVDGFNVPMDFSPTGGCERGIWCSADINGQWSAVLKDPGGCNNPCTVIKIDEYCSNSGSYQPTNYSIFYKGLCLDAYSYPKGDQNTKVVFNCSGGTNYKIVFCP